MRLYLLALLSEGDQHGYQLIASLRERFGGGYSPSAGTIYPRLRQLEREGLVNARREAGRIVYQVTPAGDAVLAEHAEEVGNLDAELGRVALEMTTQLRSEVQGSARDLRAELRAQAAALRAPAALPPFGAALRQEMARFATEWGRLVPPEITPSEAQAALSAAIAAALAQLRETFREGDPRE
ncbi:MAG: PadR family transcriptional regulator [Candidatus Dormiibacterota bacterium]